ncbi:MAG TPA: signal recognition particle receptor subunit alpha [Geobacterales bacterium]|nr:signal recognition particle receptor subunit alpha [Geobacterales bacterium]
MSFLKDFSKSLKDAINKLKGSTGDEAALKEFIRDIQRILLRADVNVNIVLELSNKLQAKIKEDPPAGFTRKDLILKELYDSLIDILGGRNKHRLELNPSSLNIIMLVGIQGSGKTTTAAKLAYYLKKRNYRVGLISADTYRLGAYYQLMQLAQKIEVPFYGEAESKDSIMIAMNGIKALSGSCNVLIIDTAGRHRNEASLIEEMKEMAAKINPTHVILVIDATIGQAAYNQAKAFNEATKIGSIIITKLDGSAKGGGAISAAKATGAKILFIGIGEKIEEFEEFDPVSFTNQLLGLGDIDLLSRKIEEARVEQKIRAEKFMRGEFNLKELVDQIKEFRKMGPLSKLLNLIPGFSFELPDEAMKEAEKNLDKWEAIINSMTKKEITDPKIIDRSRARRIARGAGVDVKDVERLIDSYNMMKRNVKRLKRFGINVPYR